MDSGLRCEICSVSYSKHRDIHTPKLLDCLHTFCQNCLEKCCRGNKLKCFLCQTVTILAGEVSDLKDNFLIQKKIHLQEILQQDPICGNCELAGASEKCLQCEDDCSFLCMSCAAQHSKMKSFRSHQLVHLKDFRGSISKSFSDSTDLCAKHPEEHLIIFCEICDIPICRNCLLHEHKTHQYIFMDAAHKSWVSSIATLIIPARERLHSIEDSLDLVKQEQNNLSAQKREISNDIHTCFADLIALLKQREKLVLQALDLLHYKKHKALYAQLESLQYTCRLLKSACDFSSAALTGDKNVIPLLKTKNAMAARLQLLKGVDCVLQPVDCADIEFQAANESLKEMIPHVACLSSHGGTGTSQSLQGETTKPPRLITPRTAQHCQLKYEYFAEGCYAITLQLPAILSGSATPDVRCSVISCDYVDPNNGVELLNARNTDCSTSVCEWNVVPVDLFACLLVELQVDGEDVPGSPLAIPGLELEGESGLLFGVGKGHIESVSGVVSQRADEEEVQQALRSLALDSEESGEWSTDKSKGKSSGALIPTELDHVEHQVRSCYARV